MQAVAESQRKFVGDDFLARENGFSRTAKSLKPRPFTVIPPRLDRGQVTVSLAIATSLRRSVAKIFEAF